jgi:hypothetical protein
MPLVLPTSFFNAHYRFELEGSSHKMSFALAGQLNAGVDADAFATDLSDAFSDDLTPGYGMANMYNQWSFHGVHVLINTGAGIQAGDFDPALIGGGGGAETVPPNGSVIVKKSTGFAGVAARGRMYFPPISAADVDVNDVGIIDSVVLATIGDNVQNWLDNTLTAVTEIAEFVLLHEQASPGPGTPTAITSFVVENQLATQRRRLR